MYIKMYILSSAKVTPMPSIGVWLFIFCARHWATSPSGLRLWFPNAKHWGLSSNVSRWGNYSPSTRLRASRRYFICVSYWLFAL